MKRIYSSKLYIASSRKERINAALLAEGNLGLVQQLAEDLDEKYQTPSNLGEKDSSEEVTEEETDTEGLIIDEDINPETDLITEADLTSESDKSRAPKRASTPSPEALAPKEATASEETSAEPVEELIPESPGNDVTEASTKISCSTESDLSVLKGTLNSREDTSGVNRIAIKNNEVWIYYSDDTNLNNIMVNVIEYIDNAGYTDMTFNRIARSDNAIVFENAVSTEAEPQSIVSEE